MGLFRKTLWTLGALLRRARFDQNTLAELEEHIERETEDMVARGIAPGEASARARAALGRIADIRQDCRDARGTAAWDRLLQDTRFALRMLARRPTFTAMALAAMALGIGSTTAVYSVVDAVLIRPLPFRAPERLFSVNDVGMPGPFETLRANSRLAGYAATAGVRAFTIPGRDHPERVYGSEVSANLFRVLGVAPLIGRPFRDGEDKPGSARVVLLSHAIWRQRFGANPDVVGRPISLDEKQYSIVGVMPAGFAYPAPDAMFWIPLTLDPSQAGAYWGSGGLSVVARLRDGASSQAAQAELEAWIPRILAMFPWRMPDSWARGAVFEPLRESLVAGARLRSLLLMAAAALLLLMAVANVANLMAAQTAARRGELSLRASLGATPARLARQLLTEASVLALAGGALGIAAAFVQLEALKHWLPVDTPRLEAASIDARVLAFAFLLALLSGLVFGLLPAWTARRPESPNDFDGARSTTGAPGRRAGAFLVAAQAAFAAMLLVAAGLLLRTLWTLINVDPGFRAAHAVTAELSLAPDVSTPQQLAALYARLQAKLAAYPGVTSVAAADELPLENQISAFAAAVEDHPRPPSDPAFVLWRVQAAPAYPRTLGIPILEGRGFTDRDRAGSPPVALVARSTARRFWPNQSALGKHVKPVWDKQWRTIVGVVGDVANFSLAGPPDWIDGAVYLPLAQPMTTPQTLQLVVRLDSSPEYFERSLPGIVAGLCPECALGRVESLAALVRRASGAPRSTALLVAAFAAIALLLAGAGVYGVVSHGVVRRTKELGVRAALGAGRGAIVWLVIGRSLRDTAAGACLGLALAWAAARSLRSLLYGVGEHDWLSFALSAAVLLAAALLAAAGPARRAARIDPVKSLRQG